MPLSPQDVRNKLFTPVRFKPGYDEDEVDAFLDEVEAELTRLGEIDQSPVADNSQELVAARAEVERLRGELLKQRERSAAEAASLRAELDARLEAHASIASDASRQSADGDARQHVEEQLDAVRQEADARVATLTGQLQQAATAVRQAQQQAATATAELAQLRASRGQDPTASSMSTAALSGAAELYPLPPPTPTEDALRRTLLLAQRTADEAVAEARAEADQMVTSARDEANAVATKAAAEYAEVERRRRTDHQTAIERGRAEQDELIAKLEELRSFERDYRGRLRAYLHLQLQDLESSAGDPPAALGGRSAAAIGAGAETQTPAAPSGDAADLQPSAPASASAPTAPVVGGNGAGPAVGPTAWGAAPREPLAGGRIDLDAPAGAIHADGADPIAYNGNGQAHQPVVDDARRDASSLRAPVLHGEHGHDDQSS